MSAAKTNRQAPRIAILGCCALVATASRLMLAQAGSAETASAPRIVAPSRRSVRDRALETLEKDGPVATQVRSRVDEIGAGDHPVLDALVFALAALPEVRRTLETLKKKDVRSVVDSAIWSDPMTDRFLRDNLRVFVARELVRRRLHDEALILLTGIPTGDLADPATYHFHHAACLHQLHRRDEALRSLDLLEAVDEAPKRYLAAAALMRPALESLRREELGGIAHDMRDLRRRFELGRADQRVRDIGDEVLARLDRLVEENESRRKQAKGAASGKPSGPAPANRGQGGPIGNGAVDDRSFGAPDPWGNLPDKQREQVLQSLGRDFPSHYRAAIEEYFRKLARTDRP